MNLRFEPSKTFIYDAFSNNQTKLETLLDQISFYSELTTNIKASDFLSDHSLSRVFIVTSTFEQANAYDVNQEYVATVEG
jgi:hypothetical protein